MTKLLGKPSINPVLFITGKLAGYLVWVVLVLSLVKLNDFSQFYSNPLQIISSLLLLFGLVLIILSLIYLGKSISLGVPKEKTPFKQNGIYRFSRNPMYVGFHLTLFAAILFTLNFWIFLLSAYSIFVYHLIILGEEKFLKKRFGIKYLVYFKKVRRYF